MNNILVVLRIKVHHFLDLHMFMMQIWIVRLFSQVFINKENINQWWSYFFCFSLHIPFDGWTVLLCFRMFLGVYFLFMHLPSVSFCISIYMNAWFFFLFLLFSNKKILLIGIYKFIRWYIKWNVYKSREISFYHDYKKKITTQ